MTGKNGDRKTQHLWSSGGVHKLVLAVVKSLEKFPEFAKVHDTLRSLYQQYHYNSAFFQGIKGLSRATRRQDL